jgi:hypothetical protein
MNEFLNIYRLLTTKKREAFRLSLSELDLVFNFPDLFIQDCFDLFHHG